MPGEKALIHNDPGQFAEFVQTTRSLTGFAPRLIEKDYYCGVILAELAKSPAGHVFKGGTSLAKVHLGFNRLSEDLDFVIPMPENATRGQRSANAQEIKRAVSALAELLRGVTIVKPLTGANSSLQYLGTLGYKSVVTNSMETIKVDVSLWEPLLLPWEKLLARTILRDPESGQEVIPPFELSCMSRVETYAEKFRAALSRAEPAIRDFYDIDYAVRNSRFEPFTEEMVSLVERKMAIPGTKVVEFGDALRNNLAAQVEAELWPVIAGKERNAFNLDRSLKLAGEMAGRLSERKGPFRAPELWSGGSQNRVWMQPAGPEISPKVAMKKKKQRPRGVLFRPHRALWRHVVHGSILPGIKILSSALYRGWTAGKLAR